jgi:hypothetical protein
MKLALGLRFKRIGNWLAGAAFVGVVGGVLLLAL